MRARRLRGGVKLGMIDEERKMGVCGFNMCMCNCSIALRFLLL
jgi:hypothetical protein